MWAPRCWWHTCIRDDHGAGVDSGRSLDFRPEPESKFRSVQEPIKYFKGLLKISVMMLVYFKLNGIN